MIYLFLANGFEEAEAVCPLDMLRRAGLDVKTVSVSGERIVYSSHGVGIEADMSKEEAKEIPDAVILPGGMPGAENLKNSAFVRETVKKTVEAGGYAAAICAAPMVLGDLGLLSGKQAICYPGFEGELKGAGIKRRAVVVDGRIVTAIGPGAAYEFGLKLVELFKGKKEAEAIARGILPV